MQQTELVNATSELVKYKGHVTARQINQAALAIDQDPSTVRRYINGDVRKLHTANDLLTWLRENTTLPASITAQAA